MSENAGDWIKNAVTSIEEQTSQDACSQILQSCGRRCAPEKLISQAKRIFDSSKDFGEFLARFSEVFDALHVEDNAVYIVYPQCYCPHIRNLDKEDIPNVYCECSVGWIRELFEQAVGKPVSVERIATVVAGDPGCRFKVSF